MTDVIKTDTRKIDTLDDARALYAPPPAAYTGKMGLEVEMPVVDLRGPAPAVPTPEDMEKIQQYLIQKGYVAQLEPAGVLEYAGPAFDVSDVAAMIRRTKSDLAAFNDAAEKAGYTRAPYNIVPSTTEAEALAKTAARERLQVSIRAMQEIFPPETLRLPLLTAAVQASFSPRDNDEMFDMAYRGYALTPLLMASCNSFSGFVAGEDKRQDILPRAKYYESYERAGGISNAFLKASNSAEFIDNHIRAVFNAPMHFAYDLDGGIIAADAGNRLTFEKLKQMGLNTRSNYELAETFLYNDIKVCNLRDESGAVIGKRIEIRGADSGYDQPVMAALLTAALVPAGKAADDFKALLADYGFTGNPKTDAPLLLAARRAVVEHGGRFMDVDFGMDPQTGRPRKLRDFAAAVAAIVEARYAPEPELAADVARLTQVLRSGNCDARLFAARFSAIGDAVAAMAPAKPRRTTL